MGDAFRDDREKSQNLLLPSHLESMKEVYESLDKYNDGILKRADFLMALRTDSRVVDFIDMDAVKVAAAKQKILTLDQVLVEIERDEVYEMMNTPKQADSINHKEFITWREFLSYFEDYKEIEERNKKTKKTERIVKTEKTEEFDPEAEFKSLLEQEKDRRLKALPKLRPADQIDISEQHLQTIKEVFDQTKNQSGGNVNFFVQARKNPKLKQLSSAIARDPEGTSRIQKETFQ